MGWKTIKGKRYFYEWIDQNGERFLKCRGSGNEAQTAATRVAHQRTQLQKEQDILRKWQIQDSKAEWLTTNLKHAIDQKLDATLARQGIRRVKRHWRKMQSKTRADMASAPYLSSDDLDPDDALKLEDEIRTLALDSLIREGPIPPISKQKLQQLTTEVSAKAESLRAELTHAHVTAIETLLIEQIITAWVQWFAASYQLETANIPIDNFKLNAYLEKRYQQSQENLSNAIDHLTKIRCVSSRYLAK